MNKKCLSVFISTFLLLNMASGISFAAKKDVADPVLQEIIAELGNKMPRFINKYGAAIFVADEQMTRGSFLQALYEYDKKSSSKGSASAVGVISKTDYDALNTRVIALEKKVKNGAGAATSDVANSKGTKSVELVDIMDDLELNMPMLLDNTLENSKVFKALEKKVNSSVGGGVAVVAANTDTTSSSVSQKSLATIQRNIISLNKKVDAVEMSLASVQNGQNISVSGKQGKLYVDTQVLSDLKNLQKELDAMNEKVSLMEAKLAKTKGVSSVYSGPSQEDYNDLKVAVIQVNRSYVALGKRVDTLEKEQQYYVSSSSNSTSAKSSLSAKQMQLINAKINSIKQSVEDIKTDGMSSYSNTKNTADIKKIEKRLSNLENSKDSSDSSSSGSSKAGTIAKISLGLSLVAALFIAR